MLVLHGNGMFSGCFLKDGGGDIYPFKFSEKGRKFHCLREENIALKLKSNLGPGLMTKGLGDKVG